MGEWPVEVIARRVAETSSSSAQSLEWICEHGVRRQIADCDILWGKRQSMHEVNAIRSRIQQDIRTKSPIPIEDIVGSLYLID